MSNTDARIHDRGYRRFDGVRRGPLSATRTLAVHSLYRVLGMRRSARAKVLPVLAIALAYLPAIAFVGIAAFLPKALARTTLPTYADYYGYITAAIVVFTALVAPEVLCPDRRSRMLGLYLASPLTRGRYVLAKVVAVVTVLAAVTLGPPLVLVVAYSLEGFGPGPGDLVVLLLRVVLSGVILAAFYTALSLGASSLTDRRGFASTGIILLIVLTGAAAGVLVDGLDGSHWFRLIDPNFVVFESVQRVYGVRTEFGDTPTWAFGAGVAAWTIGGLGLLWWRYRRLEITR